MIGFHQKCHSPNIPASALELDNPWKCVYCLKGLKNPYLTESIDVLQSLFEEDSNDTLPQQQQQQKSTAEPSSQPAVPENDVVIKQECLSDDDDDSTYSMEQSTTPSIPSQPSSTTSMHTKKRKVGNTVNIFCIYRQLIKAFVSIFNRVNILMISRRAKQRLSEDLFKNLGESLLDLDLVVIHQL